MKPVRYVLKAGDTLWRVAEAHYGDPARWPDLYAFNNRPDILAMTERPLVNPDRLVPGQAIFLPASRERATQRRAPASQATRSPGVRGGGSAAGPIADGLARNVAAETLVNGFAHGFHLADERLAVRGEAFGATLRISGAIALQRNGPVPLVNYSLRSAETQARTQSAMLLGRLLAARGTRLGWNAGAARVRYHAPLLDLASVAAPEARLKPGVTARGEPVLTAEITLPDFAGRIANHTFVGQGVTLAVELRATRSATASAAAPTGARGDDPSTWTWASAAPSAGVMLVGTILSEACVTPGGGLTDIVTMLGSSVAGRSLPAGLAAAALPRTPVRIGG